MTTIKALISFAYISDDGNISSYTSGQVYEVASAIATEMIAVGYAEEYSSGGGSSDFSIVEVAITNTGGDGTFAFLKAIMADEEIGATYENDSIETQRTFTVILYKGKSCGELDCEEYISSTGGVVYDDGELIITGDCSITCKGREGDE